MDAANSNNAQPPVNPFAVQQSILRERLQFLLATLHPVLHTDVTRALGGEGKLLLQSQISSSSLSPNLPAGVWPLMTLLVAQHISPEIDAQYAGSVAIAVECFVCALDLLDDVEDDDQNSTIQALGVGRALNVSTTLLMLAQKSILSLSQYGIPPIRVLHLLNTFQESALVATAGQHRDLLAEQRLPQDLTQEECIEIAAAKAGALMCLACRLGALCAGADDVICEHFSKLGELLGIAHQLDNDAHDLYYLLQSETSAVPTTQAENITRSFKTDLIRRKKTLPVVLAARTERSLQEVSALVDKEKKEKHIRALHEGIIATWGICLLYRERARDRLHLIEDQRPVAPELHTLLNL